VDPQPADDLDQILFRSPIATIGRFDCPTSRPDFANTGPTSAFLAVFPRTAVAIEHEGREPILVDPSIATLYNRAQSYRRAPISPEGDRCEWFALSEGALRAELRTIDPRAADARRPIRFTHAPCAPRLYLLQRVLVRALCAGGVEALEVEETALLVFRGAIRAAYEARMPRGREAERRTATRRAHRTAIDSVRAALAADPGAALTLSDAAHLACMSPCHLSRLFAELTGQTLSSYRNDIRLRAALEHVLDEPGADLTGAALSAGFSSHSHFTNRFRRRFGFPPSAVRREDMAGLLREIRKSMQAGERPRGHSCGSGRRSAA
jgi:AraC-like DNA-binding protein